MASIVLETQSSFDGSTLVLCFLEDKCLKLTFPEFHFETEAKVDFPSACT